MLADCNSNSQTPRRKSAETARYQLIHGDGRMNPRGRVSDAPDSGNGEAEEDEDDASESFSAVIVGTESPTESLPNALSFAEPMFYGQLSGADVPPALRPFLGAQQAIAVDAVRVDFKKASAIGCGNLAPTASSGTLPHEVGAAAGPSVLMAAVPPSDAAASGAVSSDPNDDPDPALPPPIPCPSCPSPDIEPGRRTRLLSGDAASTVFTAVASRASLGFFRALSAPAGAPAAPDAPADAVLGGLDGAAPGQPWVSRVVRYHLDAATHFSPEQRRHVERLVSLLSAYSVYDPELGYCQGMSDLALPFLLLFKDDALAFACFVRLMAKVRSNFLPRANGMFERLSALGSLVHAADPPLAQHLASLHAGHYHFAHRMFAAQMRRELPAELALRVWEQLWSDDLLEQLAQRREADARAAERLRRAEEGAMELSDIVAGRHERKGAIAGTGAVPAAVEVAAGEGIGGPAAPAWNAAAVEDSAERIVAPERGAEESEQLTSESLIGISSASLPAVAGAAVGDTAAGDACSGRSPMEKRQLPFSRELSQYLVAAVVLSQRRQLMECTEHDDVLRLFQSMANLSRGEAVDALRRARELRERLAPRRSAQS
ncbi:hypothetical protein GPECTOR_13g803 [Gonium pectorale]|uniref:Rab-GAP TBC domain-containing protein n=1 Tax=Gonium pectorale TaxID=33097 RepID=A0A150GN74_GONPE|nr:hypothetical protein GPECTOR_13g803 [Gonium pectorale]|eukprot:KXZ51316.1 hypothetical protein GPECTOR_13g803 [Gonium pectorale]